MALLCCVEKGLPCLSVEGCPCLSMHIYSCRFISMQWNVPTFHANSQLDIHVRAKLGFALPSGCSSLQMASLMLAQRADGEASPESVAARTRKLNMASNAPSAVSWSPFWIPAAGGDSCSAAAPIMQVSTSLRTLLAVVGENCDRRMMCVRATN